MTDLDAIRERHHIIGIRSFCAMDDQRWPCDTAQALARVAELEAALGDFVWLGNNLHNAGTLQFREFYEVSLSDARKALRLPDDRVVEVLIARPESETPGLVESKR